MNSLLPAILKVLDVIPFKGYRTTVFALLLGAAQGLAALHVISTDVANDASLAILPMIGYFGAKHE